ncbi:lanthionine synthetase LanC family protein [Streptomyces anulatus]|uniref:lanthionine synthetase LanC family protein n=1 Tax=Streptomyces anulatus TaxID=1892 RepID=UPI0034302FC0
MKLAEGPLTMAADVSIVPARELPRTVRETLGVLYDVEGAALGRRASRSNATFVNKEVLDLLGEFREPTTVVTAVINYARRTGQDADRVLEESYRALTRLRGLGLLAAPQETAAAGPVHRVGDPLGPWRVTRCLQSYEDEDCDVYLAAGEANETVVCKVARQADSDRLRRTIRHEAAALRFLRARGAPVPEPVAVTHDGEGRPLLAMSRVPGRRIDQRAQVMRRTSVPRLVKGCCGTLDALRRIHATGALHGDVHGGNYLLTEDDTVVAIDFPYASLIRRPSTRHGVPRLMDPQWARAKLTGGPEALSSPEAEQYSLAALLYFLLTGEHHYAPVTTEADLLATLAEGQLGPHFHRPPAAVPSGLLPVLERALRPEPSDRWPGVAEFSDAFRAAAAKGPSATAGDTDAGPADGRASFAEYLSPSAVVPASPPAGMAFGTSGTATALLRASGRHDDPALLAWADLWSHKALAGLEDRPDDLARHAGAAAGAEAAAAAGGGWHGALGVLGARVAVAHALDDRLTMRESVERYLREHRRYCTPAAPLDLTHGLASCLLMDAHLLSVVRIGGDGLRAAGASAARLLSDAIGSSGDRPGLAHGTYGHLLAVLAWQAASGEPPPGMAPLTERLGPLAGALRGRAPAGALGWRPGWESSWCNGATGIALLFLTAADALGTPAYVEDAERALHVALTGEPRGYDLCCGVAGRLYALRRVAGATGERAWDRRAEQDVRELREGLTTLGRHGLSKGRAGVLAVLDDCPDEYPGLPLIDAPRHDPAR